MIELEGVVAMSTDMVSAQLIFCEGETTRVALSTVGALETESPDSSAVLHVMQETAGDEWLAPFLTGASTDAIAHFMLDPGGDDLSGPEQEEIVITGRRPTHDPDDLTGVTGGVTGGSGGTGSPGGGSPSGGVTATAVAQHTQDCGTEDGAAVQVAKHVMGVLPSGVSGPEIPLSTSAGNNWTTVEFGAVIVKNLDGSYGAFNNMIYSSNQPLYAGLPNAAGQPVQGLWHSHITRGGPAQEAIDRYPSPGDWNALARVGGQTGTSADPSIWLTGPDKVTREFKLSERNAVEGLSEDQMKAGEGLAGRDRTQACG